MCNGGLVLLGFSSVWDVGSAMCERAVCLQTWFVTADLLGCKLLVLCQQHEKYYWVHHLIKVTQVSLF